jgi:membrane associated rhomboid family serine protease
MKLIIIQRALIIAAICAGMLVIHLIDIVLGGTLKSFGIVPRHMSGLYGIVAAPWLHANFGHLFNNLVGIAIFGSLCLIDGVRRFALSSLIIMLIGGGLVWLFGRSANHIGASGWLFGLWSLVITQAWFDRRLRTIAISIIVVFLYGGMAYGVLPTERHISFEMHIFGAIAGGVAAYLFARRATKPVAMPAATASDLKFWP